ncbi:ADP-ribosylation factor-like protein 13B [Megalops cyprinoides]|uniref:ADP-ribosylation factor-like protein 13B n=1 Tax=Megalops cyprinoides TaxID=118141 RepID=UPI001863EA12|nr:ADP-ribosylation factor-like protein 13B [Megalops cyprinoides]
METTTVTLALLGLDNAGKTATVKSIQGENPEDVTPTVGFSAVDVTQGEFAVSIFDLGGAQRIRDIWKHYFSESHAVVYVVDSSDAQRMEETRDALAKVLEHPCIAGKPVLLLANKQDREGALREADIIDKMSLEKLVNQHKCRCKIVPCSVIMARGRKAIESGLKWLLETVALDYEVISKRVQKDTAEQRGKEEVERRGRAERVRQVREERMKKEEEEAEHQEKTAEEKKNEKQEDKGIMDNPFQPIRDIISEMEGSKRQTEKRADPEEEDAVAVEEEQSSTSNAR